MKVLLVTLLFCCHVLGRPSDPVIREFGTQSNNPNVKVFSTYPTLKPPVLQDNPNDLEKGPDQEKYQKDEAEVTETKGEEITKVQTNLTDVKTLKEQLDNVTEQSTLEAEPSAGELVPVHNDSTFGSESVTPAQSEIEDGNTADEVHVEPSADIHMNKMAADSDTNPQIEMGSDQDREVGSVPVTEDIIVPISEADLVGPLAIDAPVTIIPYITEEFGDIPEEDIMFAIPDMDLNEDEIYELNEEEPSFNTGVILPELVPAEAVPNAGNEDMIVPLSEESSTLLPPIAEESEGTADVRTELPIEELGSIQPAAEMTKDIFEPMASLTEESSVIDPVAEEERISPFEPQGDLNDESAIDTIPMGEGDLGGSVSMIEQIPPMVEVEAEPEMLFEPISFSEAEAEKEMISGNQVNDIESEGINTEDNSTNVTLTEETSNPSVQMAGFMSDASKSFPEAEQTTEETLPSATDLSFTLDIKEHEDSLSPPISNASQVQTQMEPMDQLDVIDTQQSISEKDSILNSTTEESVPTLNPIELMADEETNDDPTLNEAI